MRLDVDDDPGDVGNAMPEELHPDGELVGVGNRHGGSQPAMERDQQIPAGEPNRHLVQVVGQRIAAEELLQGLSDLGLVGRLGLDDRRGVAGRL